MNKIKLLLALMALALPTMAKAERIPTYVAVATFTAGGTGTNAFAFQNTSATREISIIKIDVVPTSGATVTSGPMNFWVMTSTQMVHGGTTQVASNSFNIPNWTAPAFVAMSTGPVAVQYEGKNAGASALPIAIIGANPDETGTPVMNTVENGLQLEGGDEQGILLPRNTNRGIVLLQKQFGATDWTAGTVMVRLTYIIR